MFVITSQDEQDAEGNTRVQDLNEMANYLNDTWYYEIHTCNERDLTFGCTGSSPPVTCPSHEVIMYPRPPRLYAGECVPMQI